MSEYISFEKYVVIVFCFFVSSCQASHSCNQIEKSHKKKFVSSPIVVVGKFLEYVPSKNADQTVQNAKFRLEKRLKGMFLHGTDGTFIVPLYRGHSTMSNRIFCLSEKLLTPNERYVLFLNHKKNSKNELTWKSMFVAEKLNENDERIMNESAEVPYFELQMNTESMESLSKRAEIRVGDPLYVRCTVNGEVHNEPSMSWNYNGHPLQRDLPDKLIETNHKTLTSTLKIAKFDPFHHGNYECSVKRKDGRPQVTKLKVEIKEGNYSSLFNEQLCSSNNTDRCKNGGVCVVHKQTNAITCRCAFRYHGVNCEYSQKTPKIEPIHEGHNKNVITVGCVIGLALILAFAAFVLFIKHRSRKNTNNSTSSNLIKTLYLQNNGRLPSIKETDETKILLPQCCPTCHQEISGNRRHSNFPHFPIVPDIRKSASFNSSRLLEQESAIHSPESVRSQSIPGYFKMPDVDDPKGTGLQFVPVPYTTSLKVPKVRHLGTSEDDLESPKLYEQRPIVGERRSNSTPGSLISSSMRHSSQDSEPLTIKTKHPKLARAVQYDDFSSSEPNTPISDVITNGKNRELYESKNDPILVSLADD